MMAEIRNSQMVRAIPLVLTVGLLCQFVYAKVLYVDDDAIGANNGSSWQNACKYLQDALAAAVSGDEIRVAEGAYKPDLKSPAPSPPRRSVLSYSASAGDRIATFQLKNGVTIKGGYAGLDAPEPDIRDIKLHETILSGDLNGDDGPDFASNAENSYHVVAGSGTNATAVLDGCTITGGNADDPISPGDSGGGMYNIEGSPSVTNCTFSGNYATWGGAVCNAESSPTLTNCTFRGNSAHWGGGMHNVGYGGPQMINCTFSGNIAKDGAGMSNHKRSSPRLINCTFTANQANAGAGGITCADSSPIVINTILWGDIPNEIDLRGSSITISCCDVQGGWPGAGNINADPLFVDADGADNVVGTADDNLRLLRGSPCIDAGDKRSIPSSVVTDLGGDARIINGQVDMGAYEGGVAPPSNIYHVNVVNGDNSNNGLSFKTAFATIQRGIDTAEDGDKVLVWPGICSETINFSGKAITVRSAADVAVLEAPDDFAVSFHTGEGPDSVLKNFVVRNSYMGIFIAGSSPTICNVTVTGNKSGIEAYAGAQPDISNSILWDNTDGDLFQCQARYSCIERKAEGQGEGNISADPLFVDSKSGDYHLRSERGRYWPEHNVWVLDKVNSPCIDRADPNADCSDEPMPNGGCINMGVYGGTAYASMSEAAWLDGDMNRDGTVNMVDLAVLAESWLRRREAPPLNQPPEVSITAPADGAVLPYTARTYIKAEATDVDGFVVKVEFFVDGNKIGEDTDSSDDWTIYWGDHAVGEYELMARATDDGGASRDSTTIDISLRPFGRSSRRYKANIEDLQINLDKVLKLRPVRFQWKTTGHEDVGLVAEEVAQVLGDLVIYDRQDRPEAVQYDKLALYLLAVVKAQQQRIAALEESETQNKSLTRRIEALEGLLHEHQSVSSAGKEMKR